jgi:hypothetical protein
VQELLDLVLSLVQHRLLGRIWVLAVSAVLLDVYVSAASTLCAVSTERCRSASWGTYAGVEVLVALGGNEVALWDAILGAASAVCGLDLGRGYNVASTTALKRLVSESSRFAKPEKKRPTPLEYSPSTDSPWMPSRMMAPSVYLI